MVSIPLCIKIFSALIIVADCVKLSKSATNGVRRLDFVQDITIKEFTIDAIDYHNAIRKYHGVPPLTFDAKVRNHFICVIAVIIGFLIFNSPNFDVPLASHLISINISYFYNIQLRT